MLSKKTAIPDLMFGIQIAIAFYFCGHLIARAFTDLTGTSVIQNGLVFTYLAFLLTLAIGAYRAQPSRASGQNVIAISVWLIFTLGVIGAMLVNGRYHWSKHDTVIMISALVATVGIILCKPANKKYNDPAIKGLFVLAFKSMPQVLLAWKVWDQGGSGIPIQSLLIGHLSVFTRFGQIYYMFKDKKGDPNRFWLFVSEVGNGSTWLLVTIAWFARS